MVCFREVSSAGLVIANHQDIKAEIEARAGSFTACTDMGNTLLNNNHYASDEVYTHTHTHIYSPQQSLRFRCDIYAHPPDSDINVSNKHTLDAYTPVQKIGTTQNRNTLNF